MQSQPTTSSHPLLRLWQYSGNYRDRIRLAVLCSILNKLFDLAPPVLIGAAVDIVVRRQDSIIAHWGFPDPTDQLIVLAVLTFIIWALESLFEYAFDRLWRNLAQSIQHELRLDSYRHVQQIELAWFERQRHGSLMSILNDDINQLERFLNGGANGIIQLIVTVLAIGGAFFILAPGVAWMAMLPMPFIIWGSIGFQKKLAPYYADVRDKVGALNSRLSNNFSGITTIKSFTAEDEETEKIRVDSEAYRVSNKQAIRLSAAFTPLIRIVILVGFSATLLFGGIDALNGTLEVATYSVLVFLTQRLLWPLTRLGETLDLYQRAMASTIRVLNLLDTPITIRSGSTPLPLESVEGEIELDDISFAYTDRDPVFENFSLNIPAGKTIAVVGSTGSGKSTLVKLLLRLYDVNGGRVRVDGVDIREMQLQDLRRAIGLVSQDIFLFHGSVAENIRYGRPDATDEEVIAAARIAEAEEFIVGLPQGYDTIVGERGERLSGGQRQRISIARAVLKNPPILILDEATSAVDNETEAAIQRSLEKIAVDRTTIVIAHRLSTIRNADRIVVLENGKIVEDGKHEALLERDGVYERLWSVQTGVQHRESDRIGG
ncbi:MAG: ABC transporter ATP-binding protein [Ignavibacteriae bacterium]|nr:ABC transporter ATP-binding protein [Ignavibacteriota bacterium]MCB9216732.1 ABC transporter ATP-binding protein [Ignavibacteria bacterium]